MEATGDKVEALASMLAIYVNPALVFEDQITAHEIIATAQSTEGLAFIVLQDSSGGVFASYNLELAQKVDYKQLSEANQATGADYLVVRREVQHNENPIGSLYFGQSLENVNIAIARSSRITILIALSIFLIGIIIVFSISSYLMKPLGGMLRVIERLKKGDWSQQAEVRTNDEIGNLAASFNQLILELHRNTNKLQNSEIRFRTLVQSMNEGLLQVDLNNEIIYVNLRLCEMLQYEQDELLGKNLNEVFPETGAELNKLSVQNPDSELPADRHFELKIPRKDGKQIWALVSTAPESDIDGAWVRSNAIITDISLQKSAQEQLEFKNEELDTFVYKASHDLKAPLNSLQGLVKIASDEIEEANGKMYMELIGRATAKLHDVLMGLLEVTMLKEGQVDRNDLSLYKMLEEILGNLEFDPRYKEIKVFNQVPADTMIHTDKNLIHSVLQNLITNAVKYHRDEGDDREVFIEFERTDKGFSLGIRDNGPGIPEEFQERIFSMFFRATNRSEGSGLGLYIVKNAIEKLGGTLTLNSTIGEGSLFLINMPE